MKAKVCIIGSGVAGGVTATELMDAGLTDIVMVESGERVVMRDYRTWLDIVTRTPSQKQMEDPYAPFVLPNTIDVPAYARRSYRDDEIENVGPVPFLLGSIALRIRGGTTVHFEGWCYRLKPEDFELRTRTGAGANWPIGYRDLESYYEQAERTMQVAGEARDDDHPPRRIPLPLPAFPFQKADDLFIRAMKQNGWRYSHTVICRNTESINNQAQCVTTGTCRYCPFGARFSGDQVLDRLEERPGFKLLTDTTALRLVPKSNGEARALEVFDQKSGKTYEIEADIFVVAGGAIESAKLLLASAGGPWPTGPGNRSDMVGRNLMSHPIIFGQSAQPIPGHTPAETDFPTVSSRHFDTPAEQKTGKFMIANQGMGADFGWRMLKGRSNQQIKDEMAKGWPAGPIVTMGEQFPDPANRVTLAPGKDRVGNARTRIHYSFDARAGAMAKRHTEVQRALFKAMGVETPLFTPMMMAAHPMGTCKMAGRPEDGVVDADLRVHGVDNLYLCGSAVFPSAGAGNPTLTIVALAHRLGEHLSGRQDKEPAHDTDHLRQRQPA